ncbi:MAG: hypothetical protein QOJ81_740 [Chloroflexota bacterium]|jgi:hypothetical protein|nr:hypothetical protein [Chloroflexota bacterium]
MIGSDRTVRVIMALVAVVVILGLILGSIRFAL